MSFMIKFIDYGKHSNVQYIPPRFFLKGKVKVTVGRYFVKRANILCEGTY